MSTVLLVQWNESAGREIKSLLNGKGHRVVEFSTAGKETRERIKTRTPEVIVIDLRRLPSHGRDVAIWLRQQKATRFSALVFIEGDSLKSAKIKELLPDAVYCSVENLPAGITEALTRKPETPVVPDTFAGYSGTPLPKKLGIKQGSKILLLSPPDNIYDLLQPLPGKVEFHTSHASNVSIVLQFNASGQALEKQFPTAASSLADGGRIWLIWPKKSSGAKTDLTQADVRAFGLQRGFVDFKISAIDNTWSGLCFSRRKPKG